MDPLPKARLVPRDAADHAVILRARAGAGARRVGAVARVIFKVTMTVGFCGAGLFAIGARSTTYRPYDTDRQLDNIRRMQESLSKMPKIDFSQHYDFQKSQHEIDRLIQADLENLRLPAVQHTQPLSVHSRRYLPEAPLSPSQRSNR